MADDTHSSPDRAAASPPRSGAPASFSAAYDAVLAAWPVPVEPVDVRTDHGTTRVNICGPTNAPPLVLLPGGGTTSTVWWANIAELAATHRVYAPDILGDAGHSPSDGPRPLRTLADLMDWLDTLLSHFGIDAADVCGYSYGARIALGYALHAPDRVHHLALIDPNNCFAGMRLGYLLHALPLLLRPTAARARAHLRWEAGGRPLDATWLELYARGAARTPRAKTVMARRPPAAQLRGLTVPTLVLLAGRSKVHDIARVRAGAQRLLPDVECAVIDDASHHGLPMANADQVNRRLQTFFGATP
ncbi:alpha/beta fold hydrolase [Streptomyces kronopolitis]|uniref:alpha/beta fold hydrolase n=1 Tax=Streptomyces kronopolitis TaxID=1612435 RepID=UPI00342112B7